MKGILALTICVLLYCAACQSSGCISTVPGSLKCQVCSPTLQLDDQGDCKLYTPIEGCNIYSSSPTGGCSSCAPNYMLSSGICLAMIQNCASTANISTCDQCLSGYALIRFSSCYSTDISNCGPGSLPRTVSGVSYCQQFSIINCNQPALNRLSCQNCSQGYSLINGICFPVQSSLPCPNRNCNCQTYYFNNNCYRIQLANCLKSSDGVYCDLCNNAYYSSNGVCVQFVKPDDINCNLLTLDGSRCAGCNQNYVLDSNFICVKNFQLCPTACSACTYNGFNLYQGNCLYSDPLCQIYNFTRQACQLCQEGYILDSRTLICSKQQTCLSFDRNGQCTQCFNGYQLNPLTVECVPLPPNCLQMNLTSGFCTICSILTTLSPSGCIFTTSNCVGYNYNGRCQNCSQGFVQVQRACLPIAANCLTRGTDQSQCSVCIAGYHLISSQCYQDIDGCLSYSNQNQCTACSVQYQLVNGKCYFNDANCLAQDENGLCIGCTSGYLPAKGRCVYYDPYCVAYDASSVNCSQSVGSFSLSDGFSLQQQLSYLNFVLQATSASQSPIASDFSGGKGQGSYSKSGIIYELPYAGLTSSSIARYSINGNILACQNGYTLFQSQCVTSAPNCFGYNQYGNCQSCNPGYDLIIDGSCAVRSNTSCQSQSGGICLVAASGFVVINGSSYYAGNNVAQVSSQGLAVSAKAGYFVWNVNNNAIAWPLDFNCLSQNQPGICLTCAFGFVVSNGKCVMSKTNCVTFTPMGLCMVCAEGYLLWAGQCRKANCLSRQPSSNLCSLCNRGFALRMGTCLPAPIQFCQIYADNSCLYCTTGYYLTASKLCSKMIQNCLTTNPQSGRCSSCVANFTYYDEQCIPLIANCDVYSTSLTTCASCLQLYYPINKGSACGYLGMFCIALSDSANCSACRNGFTLINQLNTFICVRPISNCYQYDNKANCVRCNSGYVLQFNACKSIRCNQFVPLASQCQTCFSPFLLVNNTCRDPNCDQALGQICIACLPRYYLGNGLCKLIPDPCCVAASSNGSCLQCITGYALNGNGICVSTNDLYNGCVNQEFPCTKCLPGYYLNNSLCWARKCAVYKSNRDCQTCIYYYKLQSTQRFCILYTCFSPPCYYDDTPPEGFYLDANGNLNITYCVGFSGPNCSSCQNYRYPNSAVPFGLCYPYNCRSNNSINCYNNCQNNYINVQNYPGSCLASNCSQQDNLGQCISCLPTFILNNGVCIELIIINCVTIDYVKQVCLQCLAGYQSYNTVCRPSNCAVLTNDRNITCTKCIAGYILTSNATCTIGKCLTLSSASCLQCISGYQLINGLCRASNCLNYDPNALICLRCMNGYETAPNLGICKPSNCNNFDSSLKCLQCNAGYLLQGSTCVQGDENCLSWSSTGDCLSCNSPSLIPIGNKCVIKVPGCSNYSTNGCIACLVQYNFLNGLCTAKYCQSYSTPDRCLVCQIRFQLQSDGTCTPKNCITFDQGNWSCASCEPRFQLITPLCFTYNCSKYDLKTYQCSACSPGFTLILQTCVFSNCLSSTQLSCSSCIPGFTLTNGICQAPTSNCLLYDKQQYICTQCDADFKLTSFGLCQSTFVDPYCVILSSKSQCVQCLPFFNYNLNSQQCESAFCLQFNPANFTRGRVCQSCLPGFALDTSKRYCISIYCLNYDLSSGKCAACVNGAFLNQSTCYANYCSNYSVLYSSSPICQTCRQGYQLNSNSLCVASNCASFNLDLTCSACSNGYALNANGLCQSTTCQAGFVFQNFICVPANCLKNDQGSNVCMQCLPGFVQEKQSCVSQGCIQYDQQYICLNCSAGYNLNLVNGQPICVLSVAPICPNGYYFANNTCNIISINNCSVSDSSGQSCYRCLDGYLLKNNICYLIDGCVLPSYISGCVSCIQGYVLNGFLCISLNCDAIYPNNTCRSCPPGYTLVNGACQRNIYKCVNLDRNGNCLQCLSNFALNNGRCVAVGCVAYSPTTFVCLTCGAGYSYNPSQQTCDLKIVIPNCFTALNNSFCSLCNNGYVQLSGRCYSQISFCVSYLNQSGLCNQCNSGYYVNSQGQCSPLPANCIQCDAAGQCLTCLNGYRVSKGICLPNIPNCQAFDPNTGTCKECISQYYYNSQGQCLPLPAFCTAATPSGACSSCIAGYSQAGSYCVATIAFCSIYNQNNPAYCFQCIAGYYLNAGYSCTVLPPNCINANSLGVCLTCTSSYTLVGSLCVVATPNCLNYVQSNSTTRCSQCASGYTLTPQFTCNQLPLYCLSGSNGTCLNCMANYQLYQGICVYSVANCAAWSNQSLQCSSCISGYYLSMSNSNYGCLVLPRFCLQADLYGNCLNCLQGYIIYNYQCVDSTSILNCRAYNLNTLQCVQCLSGYTLNSNFRCLPQNCAVVNNQGNCAQCLSNFLLIGNICLIQIANCAKYNNQTAICTQCLQGYSLSSDGLNCSATDPYCLNYGPQGACLACYNGYYLRLGVCMQLPGGCSSVGQNYLCNACLPQFTLISGYCVLSVSNCASYNVSGCLACLSNYYLLNNACNLFPNFCQAFDTGLNRCINCISGYILTSAYVCNKVQQNCANYNTQGQCIYCFNRYYLLGGKCYAYPNYCVNVDFVGNCISCAFGSALQNGQCIAGPGRNMSCLKFDSSKSLCVSCMSGYSFCESTGVCLPQDPACQNYTTGGVCSACLSNYHLYNGKCLLYPPGVSVLPNGGITCMAGYTLSKNACLRSSNTLTMLSGLQISAQFSFSSGSSSNSNAPLIGGSSFWSPSASKINEYLSVIIGAGKPQIVFVVSTKGNPQGWVSSYVIQFKNRPDAPFVCWNGCNAISGNNDASNVSTLQLSHPIIATELRIYPVSWFSSIRLQLDLGILPVV